MMTAPASQRTLRPNFAARRSGEQRWPAVCLVVLVVATAYQIRVRSGDHALEGSVDLQIILELGLYGAVGAFALTKLRLVRGGRPPMLGVLVVVYCTLVLLSVSYSPVPMFALARVGQLFCVLLLMQVIIQSASRRSLHAALHGFVVLCFVSTVIGLGTGFTWRSQPGRFTWYNMHPNHAGFFLSIAAVILTAYLLSAGLRDQLRWPRNAYQFALLVVVGALVATGSRTAMVGGVVGVFVVSWMVAKRRVDAVIVGAMALTLFALVGSSALESVALRDQTPEELGTLSSRTSVWEHSMDLIGQSPFVGHGYAASRQTFTYAFSDIGGAHNAFLEIAIDAGVIVGVLLVVLVGYAVVSAWRASRRSGSSGADGALVLGLVALLAVTGLTKQGLGQPATESTLWLFFAIAWLLADRRHRHVGTGPGERDDW